MLGHSSGLVLGRLSKLRLLPCGELLIKVKVQLEHINSRFTQKSPLASFRVFGYERTQLIDRHCALFRDPRHLELRCCGRYVRIESRGGAGY
jgi:hypothetical protein